MIKKTILILSILCSSNLLYAETTSVKEEVVMEKVKKLFQEEAAAHNLVYTNKMIKKGQKIFKKKLQRKCGFTAAYFAQRHTQDEWETYYDDGKFMDEFKQLCPNGVEVVKENWVEPLYLFSKEYAKDSLEHPVC